MPKDYDYNTPSIPYIVNDRNQPTSQRFTVEVALVHHRSDLTYFLGLVPNSACTHALDTSL